MIFKIFCLTSGISIMGASIFFMLFSIVPFMQITLFLGLIITMCGFIEISSKVKKPSEVGK